MLEAPSESFWVVYAVVRTKSVKYVQLLETGWQLLLLLSQFFKPLLGRSRSLGKCWATIRLSHRPKPSACAVHREVDGLDTGGQHGRQFVLLRHIHRRTPPQNKPYSISTNKKMESRPGDLPGLRRLRAAARSSGMKGSKILHPSGVGTFHKWDRFLLTSLVDLHLPVSLVCPVLPELWDGVCRDRAQVRWAVQPCQWVHSWCSTSCGESARSRWT